MKKQIFVMLIMISAYCHSQDIVKNHKLYDAPTDLQCAVDGSTVHLSWSSPMSGTDEWISFHDGTFEDAISSTDGGAGLAQWYNLESFPVSLKEVRFYTAGHQLWGNPIAVYIIDETGFNPIAGPYNTVGKNDDWVSIELDVFIEQKYFLIATYNLEANGPFVGIDDSFYNGTLFFGNHFIGFTELSYFGDFYFTGSHEAKVEYFKGSDKGKSEWLQPASLNTDASLIDIIHFNKPLSSNYPAKGKTLLGYNIFRDSIKINNDDWFYTQYTDTDLKNGTYAYSVSAVYTDGQSERTEPLEVTVNDLGLSPPEDLDGYVNGNIIYLSWSCPEKGIKDNLVGYHLFRNNRKINSDVIPGTEYSDELTTWGQYKYNVTAVYSNGSSAFSNDYVTGHYYNIEEKGSYEIMIFPNPASDYLNIRSLSAIESVLIYNNKGQLVRQIGEPGNELRSDIGDLPGGLYLLNVRIQGVSNPYKIIIV